MDGLTTSGMAFMIHTLMLHVSLSSSFLFLPLHSDLDGTVSRPWHMEKRRGETVLGKGEREGKTPLREMGEIRFAKRVLGKDINMSGRNKK